MKKTIIGLLALIVTSVMAATTILPVFAATEEKCVVTSILNNTTCRDDNGTIVRDESSAAEFNCSCDDGSGSSIIDVLSFVVNLMTIGVGILGIIGITIVGIQYLTAGGNEEKTKKAKRRMFEIVLGLVGYVLIYSLLVWLIPNFKPFGL